MPNALGFNELIYQSLPFIGVSFGIGMFFTLIYYFYAKLLNDKTLESRAKVALFTVFETMGIFILIFLLNGIFETVVYSAAGIPVPSGAVNNEFSMPHLKMAEVVMDSFRSKVTSVYMSMVISEFVIQTISQMTSVQIPMTIGPGSIAAIGMGTSLTINTGEIFAIINNIYNSLVRIVIDVMLMTIGRKAILDLALPALILIFPLGLFLRGLYITKKTGSSLIALSLVLFYIYPLSITFDGYLIKQVPAVKYGDIISDTSTSFYYKNIYAIQSPESFTTTTEENSAMTRSMGELLDRELVLAPGKYLGSIILKTGAISTAGGFINTGVGLIPNRYLGAVLQLLTNVLAGLMLLGTVDFVSLISFAFQTIIIQGTIIMNLVGMLIMTTVFDLIMCVTMYRIFADILSGDKSLVGLSKVL